MLIKKDYNVPFMEGNSNIITMFKEYLKTSVSKKRNQ